MSFFRGEAFGTLVIFILALCGNVAQAQQPTKIPRIGYLGGAAASNPARIEAFRQGLRELGYVEGKTIVIEWRYAEGKSDRERAIAAELVRLKVDVIVTVGSIATRAAKEATATIPIVMTQDPDPIGNGFVASLARPGGNITGISNLSPELSGRLIEAMRQAEEMSQVDFAKKLGISKQHLCDIEKGRKFVSPERAAKFSKVLGHSEQSFVALALQDIVNQGGLKLKVSVEAA